jgi:hypothetical protein
MRDSLPQPNGFANALPLEQLRVPGYHTCFNLDGHRGDRSTHSDCSHANERVVRGEGVCICSSDSLEGICLDVGLEILLGPALTFLCTPPELTLADPHRT